LTEWSLEEIACVHEGNASLSSTELADRIAILRDNIRQITEQAASQSGAADEDRNAERMTRLNDDLERLLKEQERRLASAEN
jgi:hypothetical protein